MESPFRISPMSRATVVFPVPGLPVNTMCRLMTVASLPCERALATRTKSAMRVTSRLISSNPTKAFNRSRAELTPSLLVGATSSPES